MNITKTDYLRYLKCPEFAWLEKHKPDAVDTSPSGYDQKLIRDGDETEEYAQGLFPDGEISETFFTKSNHPEQGCLFQPTFVTDDDLEARLDILKQNDDGTFNIYEVKSSTRVKKKADQDHVRDVTFQKVILQECDLEVSNVFVVHLNNDYVRGESLDLEELFVVENVTERSSKIESQVESEMNQVKERFTQDSIDESKCSCRRKTRSNHCDAFAYFNGEKAKTSVYNIPRIREKKLRLLLSDGITDMTKVPADFDLSDKKQTYVDAAKAGEVQIDEIELDELLSEYNYPIHFLDYETYQPAVPKLKGASPHSHIPFQASLHIMREDGDLEHYEYLSDELKHPKELADFLVDEIKDTGSIVVWNQRFEKKANRKMGERYPQYEDFFADVNERIVDQEDVFKTAYVDPDAGGRTKLKVIYPMLLPDGKSYSDLEVQNGTMAMEQWEDMITSEMSAEEIEKRREELLAYCELDTLAMVGVYQYLLSF